MANTYFQIYIQVVFAVSARELLIRRMSEQVDIAVDLGVVAAPLPEILSLRQLVETAPPPPPEIIEGVLHQGCKMIRGGTSNKSWCLLDLAVSVASGSDWWGSGTTAVRPNESVTFSSRDRRPPRSFGLTSCRT
jgi:hypothetical protein